VTSNQTKAADQKWLTLVTGAGASLHAGGPTSDEITNALVDRSISSSILHVLKKTTERSATPELRRCS
jgi:hypothetical protein